MTVYDVQTNHLFFIVQSIVGCNFAYSPFSCVSTSRTRSDYFQGGIIHHTMFIVSILQVVQMQQKCIFSHIALHIMQKISENKPAFGKVTYFFFLILTVSIKIF